MQIVCVRVYGSDESLRLPKCRPIMNRTGDAWPVWLATGWDVGADSYRRAKTGTQARRGKHRSANRFTALARWGAIGRRGRPWRRKPRQRVRHRVHGCAVRRTRMLSSTKASPARSRDAAMTQRFTGAGWRFKRNVRRTASRFSMTIACHATWCRAYRGHPSLTGRAPLPRGRRACIARRRRDRRDRPARAINNRRASMRRGARDQCVRLRSVSLTRFATSTVR
ncbi:hypothetical protein Y045_1835 [Burkholderia pseudomallei MSHR2451]|nr:hypothetical protein Y045_1835 [Burkholderia pseudomallei MSHR2451]